MQDRKLIARLAEFLGTGHCGVAVLRTYGHARVYGLPLA